MSDLMQIGDLAARTGLTVDAIRFYERDRLLHTAARSSGGFRLFSVGDLEDLTFIQNAQDLGFSLDEIRDLLNLKHAAHSDCGQIEQLLERKIGLVRRKISALRKLERELGRAVADCKLNLRRASHGSVEHCPVLVEISHRKERRNDG